MVSSRKCERLYFINFGEKMKNKKIELTLSPKAQEDFIFLRKFSNLKSDSEVIIKAVGFYSQAINEVIKGNKILLKRGNNYRQFIFNEEK